MASIKPDFKEIQKFRQWWFWLIIALIFLAPFIIKFQSIIDNGFWGTFSKGILAHISSLGFFIILLAIVKVKTTIDKSGIKLSYFPFFKKDFSWNNITEAKLIAYKAKEIRGRKGIFWRHYGSIRRVENNQGIFLKLKNGKNYLISTQKPAELKKAIANYQ